MTIFTWGDNSSIQKMQIQPYGKGEEAILYAASGAQKGDLSQVPDMLRSFGMTVVPETKDGAHTLRVRGFENKQEITKALEQNGFVTETSRQEQDSPKKAKLKINPVKLIKEKSLVASGYVYLIGDAALVASGIKRGDKNELMTGLAFSSSSVVLARYGEKKADKAFDEIYDKMLLQFAKEGVEVPDAKHIKTEDLGKPNGLIARVEDFLYNHPAEVNTAINAFAGFQLFKSGVNLSKTDKSAGIAKSIAGTLVATGMLTALLVPEKTKEKAPASLDEVSQGLSDDSKAGDVWMKPEVEEKKGVLGTMLSPLQSVAGWVQEKPLRVAGYMAMANNAFQGGSAVLERKNSKERIGKLGEQIGAGDSSPQLNDAMQSEYKNKNNWMFNMTAATSYVVANGLLSISSKDADASMGNGEDPFAQLYSASAAILANQPQEVQDAMVNKMAFHLAEFQEITRPAEEIAGLMHQKLAEVKDSPWLETGNQEQKQPLLSSPEAPQIPAQKMPPSVQENTADTTMMDTATPLLRDMQQESWTQRESKAAQNAPAAWSEKEATREAARDTAAQENELSGIAR